MKFKLRTLLFPVAAAGLVAAPLLTATSCSKNYEALFFKVTNNTGLEIEFCDVGASISSIKYGNTYLTYHQKDRAQFVNYESNPYFHGKILGRVAGRFKDGKYHYYGETEEHQLQVNETGATKNNCLHGGKDGFSYKTFKHEVIEEGTGANECTVVTFTYTSPDGEGGFDGKLDVTATYKIYKNKNQIDTILHADPDKKTLIDLSTHSLFRLGNDGDILDYELSMPNCKRRVVYNKETEMKTGQIPESLRDVVGTDEAHDFGIYNFTGTGANAKKIGEDIYASAARDPISNGYDHIWVTDDGSTVENRYVNLYNPKNKINLKVQALSTKVTGFILYSNDYPNTKWTMTDGKEDTQYAGITIEPYTYFTGDDLRPITYDKGNPFETSYSYIISQGRQE